MNKFNFAVISIVFILFLTATSSAQVKLPQKENKTPIKQTATKTTDTKPANTGPVLTLKVTTNADCNFYVDNELKGTVKLDDILKISLKTGEYQFKAVSLANPSDVKREIYTVEKTGIEKFYNIPLQEVIQNRIAIEERELKAKEKAPTPNQSSQVLSSVSAGSGPAKFFWESTVIDFGTVKKGDESSATKYFRFKNIGSEPLIISECKGSCGCTVPTCPTIPIQAGKEGSIMVHYDVNRVGPFTKTVTVTSNAINAGEPLKITGTVVE